MNKQKRDFTDKSSVHPVRGCANIGLRIISFVLMIVFGGFTAFIIYMSNQQPDVNFGNIAWFTAILALACAYIAFGWSNKSLQLEKSSAGSRIVGCWRWFVRIQAGLLMLGLGAVALNYLILSIQQGTTQYWLWILLAGFFSFVSGYIALGKSRKSIPDDATKRKHNWREDDEIL